MSDITTLPTLADRVESLTKPDRAVDAEIFVTLHGWKLAKIGPDYDSKNASEVFTPDGQLIPGFAYPPKGAVDRYYHVAGQAPQFTGSVDAAMTLLHLPAHPLWTLRTETRSHGQRGMSCSAELCVPSREFQGWSRANLACAITAAALRARAAGGNQP